MLRVRIIFIVFFLIMCILFSLISILPTLSKINFIKVWLMYNKLYPYKVTTWRVSTDIHTDIRPHKTTTVNVQNFSWAFKNVFLPLQAILPSLCSSQAIIYLTSVTLDYFVFPEDVHWNMKCSFVSSFFH